MWNGSSILELKFYIDPKDNSSNYDIEKIAIPCKNPTNCILKENQLYITSALNEFENKEYDGKLLRINLEDI